MDYLIICSIALIGSALTFFSGFGLGTLLVPVFGTFFPIEVAIMLTAIVHFLNNIFKLFLTVSNADKRIIFHFGIPSIIGASIGAFALNYLITFPPIFQYFIFDKSCSILPVKLTIALLLLFFALFEGSLKLKNNGANKNYLFAGGIISGFFGGLSGNQGALRTAFLIKSNLTKESFIATGVVIACFTDVSRLLIYSTSNFSFINASNSTLVLCATLAAFVGAFAGNKLLKKITVHSIQIIVTVMLVVFSILLGFGII